MTEPSREEQDRMNRFLFRKLPPCPVEECGADTVGPYFIGHPSVSSMRAVYRCHSCGAMWDINGQPLTITAEGTTDD